jgi:hypothetical protein
MPVIQSTHTSNCLNLNLSLLTEYYSISIDYTTVKGRFKKKMEVQNRSRYSAEQKATLIELLKNEAQLITGKFSATYTFKDAKKKWEEISSTLNSIPGAKKEWKQWRKASD